MNWVLENQGMRSFFSGQTVLVTGASGFIGRPLSDALARLGANVHAISRQEREERGRNIRWWKGDLGDLSFARVIFGQVKPGCVIHLAGHAWGIKDLTIVPMTFNDCLTSTVNVLTAAAETGCVRVLLPGSLEEPVVSDITPDSPYAAAKWACNVYGKMFRKVFGLEVVLTRIFMAYGPRQDDRKVVPYLILSFLANKSPILQSSERALDWIYIDDVVDGLLVSACRARSDDHAIDIGSGEGVSVGTVAEKLAGMIGCKPSVHCEVIPGKKDEVVRFADVEATFRRISWRPKVSLDEGLRNTIAWYEKKCRTNRAETGGGPLSDSTDSGRMKKREEGS